MPTAGQAPASTQLGTLHFPSSAKPAAQASFLTGVKALFNFEFDIAAETFQQTQKADPDQMLGNAERLKGMLESSQYTRQPTTKAATTQPATTQP